MSEIKIKMGSSSGEEPKFKPFDICGFTLKQPLTTKNSGFSKWGFCTKNGQKYFIKQFLTPVYPDDNVEISPAIKNRKCKECMEWFEKKNHIYNIICDAQNGNIIAPIRFFKDKSHFYIITECVPKCRLKFSDIHSMLPLQRHILLKVIASCFSTLSFKGIVHADMKPENIMFKETVSGFYTAKIIDFDASYTVDNAPFGDDVQGTPEYFAPESFLALAEERVKLSPKVDVFALGIIFHEMLCGHKPTFNKEYDYVYEAVLNDDKINLDKKISVGYQNIIVNMLKKNPDERWSASKVFNRLRNMTLKEL